jgi:hypothetical protein
MKVKTKYLALGLVLLFNLNKAFTQNDGSYKNSVSYINMTKLDVFYSNTVLQDPEFSCSDKSSQNNFASNPLFLNGQAMDINKFSLESKGILSLVIVKDKSETRQATPIPFYVSIRRNGKILDAQEMPFLNKEIFEINLADIFAFGKQGDMLIIVPAKAEDWKAKRILKLFSRGC